MLVPAPPLLAPGDIPRAAFLGIRILQSDKIFLKFGGTEKNIFG